jgi:hypothetical protein
MKPIYLYPNQDFRNSIATALEAGIAIGKIKGQIKIAKEMVKEGFDISLFFPVPFHSTVPDI